MPQFISPLKVEALQLERSRYNLVDLSADADVERLAGPLRLLPQGRVEDDPTRLALKGRVDDDAEYCALIRQGAGDSRPLGGTTVYCGYLRQPWGHFITNSMSRLWYRPGDVGRFLFFVTPDEARSKFWRRGNYRALLQALGIFDRMVVATRPVTVERVEIPRLGFEVRVHVARQWGRMWADVRTALLAQSTPGPDTPARVFFTRSSWNKGVPREIGIDMADRFFAANGYAVVSPETMPLYRLARILDSASETVWLSGSAAHNLLFAPEGSRAVILERCPVPIIYQEPLDMLLSHDVTHIEATLMPRSVHTGEGPFLYHFTPEWRAFAADRGLQPPGEADVSQKAVLKRLRRWIRSYDRLCRRMVAFDHYLLEFSPLVMEACLKANSLLDPWLMRRRPLFATDWLNPRTIGRFLRDKLRSTSGIV